MKIIIGHNFTDNIHAMKGMNKHNLNVVVNYVWAGLFNTLSLKIEIFIYIKLNGTYLSISELKKPVYNNK